MNRDHLSALHEHGDIENLTDFNVLHIQGVVNGQLQGGEMVVIDLKGIAGLRT